MKPKKLNLLILPALLMSAGMSHAAALTFVGSQLNIDSTADDGATTGWHSTLIAKPLDIDGDNALGSEGWIRANNGASGRSNPRRFLPGYVVAYAADGQTTVIPTFANSGSGVMDNPATGTLGINPATEDANASWHQGGTTNLNIFQFTIQNAATLTGKTLRVGVLFDAANLAPGVGATQAMAITQTVGGSATASSTQLAYGNNGLDAVYFDLTGLVNGDRFVISADAAGTNARSHIAGITFDSAVAGSSSDYDTWADENGLDGTPGFEDGKGDDPDGDGKNNLYEFAFDGDPLSGANDGKIVGKVGTVGVDQVMTLTLPVRDGAIFSDSSGDQLSALIDGIIYRIEGDETLSTFADTISEVTGGDATTIQTGLPGLSATPAPGWTYRTFRAPGTVTTVPKAFLRAQISE